jgi:toxin-antitoxin system PIN domain toxin
LKIPDVNILLYAINENSPHFARLKPWLESLIAGEEPVGFAWLALLGFLRLSTRGQIVANPFTPEEAMAVIEGWLAQPNARILHPTDRHFSILRGLLEPLGTAGNLTSDAHLAALAIEYGGELCSADNDFRRFRGLRWHNPLD